MTGVCRAHLRICILGTTGTQPMVRRMVFARVATLHLPSNSTRIKRCNTNMNADVSADSRQSQHAITSSTHALGAHLLQTTMFYAAYLYYTSHCLPQFICQGCGPNLGVKQADLRVFVASLVRLAAVRPAIRTVTASSKFLHMPLCFDGSAVSAAPLTLAIMQQLEG
ncbi:hypothetical protein ABBQ38_013439 [Trebouxia sp. C0009 RCD-2024]